MVLQEQAFDLWQMLQDLEGMFHSRARQRH
jgi:hypothetical protein